MKQFAIAVTVLVCAVGFGADSASWNKCAPSLAGLILWAKPILPPNEHLSTQGFGAKYKIGQTLTSQSSDGQYTNYEVRTLVDAITQAHIDKAVDLLNDHASWSAKPTWRGEHVRFQERPQWFTESHLRALSLATGLEYGLNNHEGKTYIVEGTNGLAALPDGWSSERTFVHVHTRASLPPYDPPVIMRATSGDFGTQLPGQKARILFANPHWNFQTTFWSERNHGK